MVSCSLPDTKDSHALGQCSAVIGEQLLSQKRHFSTYHPCDYLLLWNVSGSDVSPFWLEVVK